MKKYVAEFTGTFILVFFGTGAIIVNNITDGSIGLVGIAFTFGLVVSAVIFTFGQISGAHINPAVTLGLVLANRFRMQEFFPYIISQLGGAFLASAALNNLFPESGRSAITQPSGSASQSVLLEVILTFILMFVILRVMIKQNEFLSGIAVGAVIVFEILFAGNISGASMNPARSIAPAIVSGNYNHLWIYIAGPITGAAGAVLLFIFLQDKKLRKD